jgi:predicted nucleic acid-binding protein
MLQNFSVVIADTTCFILLEKIGELELLKSVFGNIITTSVIADEYGQPLPEWVEIRDVINTHLLDTLKIEVDAGEASAIALATELEPALLILDDLEARQLASQLNLTFTGTLGVILRAKRTGHIEFVKPLIEKMQGTNFRITNNCI